MPFPSSKHFSNIIEWSGESNVLFLIGRILFGGYFLMMGLMHYMKTDMVSGMAAQAGVRSARMWVLLSGILIALGGLGVIVGVQTDIALLLILLFLVGVTPRMHAFWKLDDPQQKMMQQMNFMRNIAYIGAVLMMYIIGDWPFSI